MNYYQYLVDERSVFINPGGSQTLFTNLIVLDVKFTPNPFSPSTPVAEIQGGGTVLLRLGEGENPYSGQVYIIGFDRAHTA